MRIPYAMRAMMGEIEKINPQAAGETRDPDALGVWRTLVLDKASTEKLTPLLDEIVDPRIAKKDVWLGHYVLGFVSDRRADDAKPFGLDRAYRVLTEPRESPDERLSNGPTRDDRRKELSKIGAARLRKKYGYRYDMAKTEIVNDILHHEGY